MGSGRVLVYGGRGALGSTCVEILKARNFWTCNVDPSLNENADANVIVTNMESWTEQAKQISAAVQATLGDQKLDAVLCVAGGWAGGNPASDDFIKNCELMYKQSVWSSAIAAQLFSKHGKEGGLLQLTGAQAALGPTSFMMGYGMAKAAVHQFVRSLAAEKSGLPPGTTALAILPVTLDTPMNRKNMPKADFSSWTPLTDVANILVGWTEKSDIRPASGSLVELITKAGNTETRIAN